MRISSLGVGTPYCTYPGYPEGFIIRADSDDVVVNCPLRGLEALAKFRKDPLDIDMWVVTDCSINMISGLERVAKMALYAGVKPLLAVPQSLADALSLSLAPSLPGPLSRYFTVHVSSGIEIREKCGFKETIRLIPHKGTEKVRSYGLVFESAEVFISGRGQFDANWVRYHAEGCRALLLNMCMDEPNWSDQFQKVATDLSDVRDRVRWYGFSKRRTFEDRQVATYLYPNEPIFDSHSGFCLTNKKPSLDSEGSVISV